VPLVAGALELRTVRVAVALVDARRQACTPTGRRVSAGTPRTSVRTPRVTIGMPVFNGARHLASALDSLLAQTFTDFELLIADNASTDRTGDICENHARRDARIRYVRHTTNRGAVYNWNFVVEQGRGQYFKWASANDWCAPTMLEHCVRALDDDPRVVVVYGRTAYVDDDDHELGIYEHDPQVLDERPSVRFERMCRELRANNAQSGLVRRDVLLRTGIERDFPGGDMGLMSELALHGGFRRLPEVLLHRRLGLESATKFRTAEELRAFLNPASREVERCVTWRTHWDYVASVRRAPLSFMERWSTLRYILRSAWWFRAELWR
jgi:glycosyltransferase involved in cell wall biosynthesis